MLISGSELISTAWRQYKQNWRKLMPYVLLLLVPGLVMFVVGFAAYFLAYAVPESDRVTDIFILLLSAASGVFLAWLSLSLATAIRDIITGREPADWKSNFSTTSPLLWPAIYTSLLSTLIFLGGIALLIVPGIIFLVWYIFSFYAVALDGKRGLGALRASKELVVGRWAAIAWRAVLLPIIFLGGIAIAIAIPLDILITWLVESESIELALRNLVDGLINMLLVPLTVFLMVTLYLNVKENPVASSTTDKNSLPPQPPNQAL